MKEKKGDRMKEKICKHLDRDESYCLMIKGRCIGKDDCRVYEEVNKHEWELIE